MTDKLRILVADDHAVFRSGLRLLLNGQPDMEVVAEAGDGRDAIRKTSEAKPDVVLFDLTMPRTHAMDTIRHVARARPRPKVVVLTMHEHPAYVHSAVAAGAAGYVLKRAADTELLSTIRAAGRAGRGAVLPLTPLAAAEERRRARAGRGRALLSPREEQVLRFLAQGYSNRQIAGRLKLSVKTVETFRSRVSKKLHLRGRAALVRYALRTGLVTIENLSQDFGAAE
ncbi:MAG TPA: response regulator transcription factor, partial [Gemmatimonadales bacterium]|nr:response regulator transcription factor [Gemmatimonadales bacterium]